MEHSFEMNCYENMIGQNLNEKEREELLNAPVYIALLAASRDGEIEESEKEMGEKITRLRSQKGDPLLREYYDQVHDEFSTRLGRMSTMLPHETSEKSEVLGEHLDRVREIMGKLPADEQTALKKSLRSFAGKIKRADRSMMQYFIIPFGISEDDDEMNNEQSPGTRHYAP